MSIEAPTFLPEVAHSVTELLPNTVYTFNPDGSAYVNSRRHMYFSRTPREGRDVGYREFRGMELIAYHRANFLSRVQLLQEGIIKISSAAA